VIGARATMLAGIPAATAFGSTIVDITLELIGEIAFIVAGLVVLALHVSSYAARTPLMQILIVGTLLGILAVGAFFIVQRRGFSFLERISNRFVPSAAVHAAALHETIKRIHAAPIRMVLSFFLHLAGWFSAAFGTWLILVLIKRPISYMDAVAIESVLCAARSAVVFVPSAIGIQEAGYAMMMPLFGLPPGIGIAVSLLRRAQQIAVGAPILASWQIAEGGYAVGMKKREDARHRAING
jgi:glycosyltransferase 2 family protein